MAESKERPGGLDLQGAERRNFWSWVIHSFLNRVAWQFKMESTLMAGLISYLSPSPVVMGLFTALNGLGRNLSPIVASPLVDRFPRKRQALLLLWGLTIVTWGVLTLFLWLPAAEDRTIAVWVFGACYTLFFAFLGGAGVAQGALLGKIIAADRRGRAMAMGMALSGVVNVGAILLVYHVLRSGAWPEPRNYALSFTLTTFFFVCSALVLLGIREEPAATPHRSFNPLSSVRGFIALARGNRNLARLMWVNALIGVTGSMLQFYTGYWRQSGSVAADMMPQAIVIATVLQVFWQAASSSYCGRLADRIGNVRVITVLLWVEAAVPVSAWVLGGTPLFQGSWLWFLGVFSLVGLRFPMYQLLLNYLLEVAPQEDHAMAIGATTAVQLILAPMPIVLGQIAQSFGYPASFVVGSILGGCAAVLALGLREVRFDRR